MRTRCDRRTRQAIERWRAMCRCRLRRESSGRAKWPFREVIEEELISYDAHRLVHSGRADGGAEDYALGGDALHRHRAAQPTWAGERGGLRESMYGVNKCRGAGDAEASGKLCDRPVSAGRLTGRTAIVLCRQAPWDLALTSTKRRCKRVLWILPDGRRSYAATMARSQTGSQHPGMSSEGCGRWIWPGKLVTQVLAN